MRRTLTLYSFAVSILSGFAFLFLAGLSESFLDYWRYNTPVEKELHALTVHAPKIARAALVFPVILLLPTLYSLRQNYDPTKLLIHGIGITVIGQCLITVLVITAAFIPSFLRITTFALP